ncbi:hypothetical protein [Microvirga massiliensis]|uniref:hypothetical protein n=1 Tax=Microvirga massiliensis TaxID=1033741 RepID=UPI00062B63B6|nr:hypothetical protein [Microvirga massiliensis]
MTEKSWKTFIDDLVEAGAKTMGDTVIHNPGNQLLRIDEVYAFVSVDEQGNEGLCAATIGGVPMPLIAADADRLRSLVPVAEQLARATGMTIKLIRLKTREELRTIRGGH